MTGEEIAAIINLLNDDSYPKRGVSINKLLHIASDTPVEEHSINFHKNADGTVDISWRAHKEVSEHTAKIILKELLQ